MWCSQHLEKRTEFKRGITSVIINSLPPPSAEVLRSILANAFQDTSVCIPVTLCTMHPMAPVTYSDRSASHYLWPSTNANSDLYLIQNTPYQTRSHHIPSMLSMGWKRHTDSMNHKIHVVHRLLGWVQSSLRVTEHTHQAGRSYRCLHCWTQDHHWRCEQYILQHRQEIKRWKRGS